MMIRLLCQVVCVLVSGIIATDWCACLAEESKQISVKNETDLVFGMTRIWTIHLHVSAENWKAMQPAQGGFPFGPPPPGGGNPGSGPVRSKPNSDSERKPGGEPALPGVRPATERESRVEDRGRPAEPPAPFRPGSFGYEFEYVKADVEFDGQIFKNVGLRFKGNGTYMLSASGRKRPFKIDFDRFEEDQRFHGLQKLNLHNNVMDPTHLRQSLSYPVFETAGIPSPRTAFAEVRLTIDGECDHELLGLYTIVEEIDKGFLKRHFQTSKGMLLKPKGTQGLEYKGEEWDAYAWFEPQSKPTTRESQRLIDALRLIHKSDDDQFRQEIANFLDLDEFARFLAANTLLANMDSFLTHVHNYYVYLSPTTNKFVLLPWDMDLSFGTFFMMGSAEQLQELSISHPYVGDNKLLDRLFAWDEFKKVFRRHLQALNEACFSEEGLTTKSIPVIRKAIQELIKRDAKQLEVARAARGPGGFGPGGFGPGQPGMFGTSPSIEAFLTKRRESVTAQLAGKSTGRVAAMGFGPGGPPGGGFGPGNFHGPQILLAADRNKDQKLSQAEFLDLATKWWQDWNTTKDDSLNGDEIKEGMNIALGAPPNSSSGGFKPPAGFGPGMFHGPTMLKAADADIDAKVSQSEWTDRFTAWFKEWDSNRDDLLDRTELIAGFNKAFGPPQGFRRPGDKPGNEPEPPSLPE